jgi:hypothetical protein|tara:strand:- start:2581 stop:2811 length:231 start_codon:yes stop_codon:yes gene_type:complete
VDEGAVVVVVVVVEHARHNSHDIIHSKTTLAAFSRFPLDRRCHHAFGEKEKEREKVFEKELSLLWSQPLFKGAFSL